MKIVFVLEHFYPYIGGAEKLFYVLTKSLVKKGFQVKVITTRFDEKLPMRETHEGIEIIRVNCWNRFAFTFFALPQIFRNVRDCDFIHTTTYNAALPSIVSGLIFRKPVFITFHEVWGELWKRLPLISSLQKNAFYLFEKFLLKLPFTKFIAVSDFTKRKLIEHGITEDKIVRIYNGIDYASFEKLERRPSEIFTFTFFGRLGVSKGLDILISAAADFKERFPKSKMKLIIPTYPKSIFNKIKNLIEIYKIEDYVEFKHNLSKEELYSELLQSSCVVIPSYSEGFCFAAAETVALKVPIISSHQGALPEVVSGKYIVMESMYVEDLTEALVKAYHGKWEEKPIRFFHLKKTEEEYLKFYQEEKNKISNSQKP